MARPSAPLPTVGEEEKAAKFFYFSRNIDAHDLGQDDLAGIYHGNWSSEILPTILAGYGNDTSKREIKGESKLIETLDGAVHYCDSK